MTRHQVWKARERARFRLMAEAAAHYNRSAAARRIGANVVDSPRLVVARTEFFLIERMAMKRGIRKAFLG